jgi:replicative DNA helicase
MANTVAGNLGPLLVGDRPLPHSLEAERAVLSCLLQDARNTLDLVFAKLQTEDCFYHPPHRFIYTMFNEMRGDMVTGQIDPVTVIERIERKGKLEEIGGEDYISHLLNVVPTTANVETYVSCVLEAHILRNLIRACADIAGRCYDAEGEVPELIDAVEQEILNITELQSDSHTVYIRDVMKDAFDFMESLHKRDPSVMGLRTGFVDLDNLITGIKPGDLIVLAARPSIGKTTLAMNIARNIGHDLADQGKAVGVFSMEMGAPQLVLRLLCSEARINLKDVRDGKLTPTQWGVDLIQACDRLGNTPIYIDDMAQLSSVELRQKARRMKQNNNVEVIIIDYLQLMRPAGSNANSSREQEVSKMSREIKALAKELQIPIILLAQLNRQAEATGARPKLSHLRESGAIEQDADMVWLMHRERETEMASPEDILKTGIETEIIVAKNRNGETGVRSLTFLPQYTRFENFTGISDDDVPQQKF